jgi:hypothetical protein
MPCAQLWLLLLVKWGDLLFAPPLGVLPEGDPRLGEFELPSLACAW